MVYDLSKFGVPTYAPTKSIPGNPHTGTSAYTSSPKRNIGHASTYGINPDIIASPKSEWELDQDTADFLLDAFNTLNSPSEDAGYSASSGGGGGGSSGGGGQFSGGGGGEYDVTWDFGRGQSFKPRGLL
jgi:hypothetical protein